MKKIVVMGGGAGTFVVLRGLRDYPVHLSAIVTMMDSGGSTGRLRKQYGVLPPGDIRQSLVALSKASPEIQKLFIYRFESGDLKGHNVGNIILATLENVSKDYSKAITNASILLQTSGDVIPVTLDNVQLCAEYEDGEVIETEKLIDSASHKSSRIKQVYLKPTAIANRVAVSAIEDADYIIIGPGDLYTSLIPNLLVEGISPAIQKSNAKILFIVNLMTKRGQTHKFTAAQHIKDIEKYLGRSIDLVLMNKEPIPTEIISFYKKYRETVVEDDLSSDSSVIRSPLLNDQIFEKTKVDKARRSKVRHDSDKLGRAIMELCIT